MSEIRALRCDYEDCNVISMPWESLVRFFKTPREDQSHNRNRKHYCYDHYPFDLCVGCNKRLRPYQSRAEDWPGTINKAKSNPPLCTNCSRKGYEHVDTRADVPFEVAQAVRRMVRSRFTDTEADEVLVMLGID